MEFLWVSCVALPEPNMKGQPVQGAFSSGEALQPYITSNTFFIIYSNRPSLILKLALVCKSCFFLCLHFHNIKRKIYFPQWVSLLPQLLPIHLANLNTVASHLHLIKENHCCITRTTQNDFFSQGDNTLNNLVKLGLPQKSISCLKVLCLLFPSTSPLG